MINYFLKKYIYKNKKYLILSILLTKIYDKLKLDRINDKSCDI